MGEAAVRSRRPACLTTVAGPVFHDMCHFLREFFVGPQRTREGNTIITIFGSPQFPTIPHNSPQLPSENSSFVAATDSFADVGSNMCIPTRRAGGTAEWLRTRRSGFLTPFTAAFEGKCGFLPGTGGHYRNATPSKSEHAIQTRGIPC